MLNYKKLQSYSYLKYFPIPFLEDFVRGLVVPFIGAGFSKNADIPKGKEMPDWNKLGELIAKDLPMDYVYSNPIEAISTYEQEYSRAKLVEKFNELLLTGKIKAGKAHIAFSKIPFELVCTTNFDFLLENAFELSSIYCRPIIDEEHLGINNLNRKDVALLKIHGDLHHPTRLVATEEDYDGFLHRHPMLTTYLANLLITKTCLFIGYSLDDPDFRQVWQLIKDRLGKLRRQAYVIGIGVSRQNIVKFERRGVKVINIPTSTKMTYAQILEKVFEELKELWSKELPSHTMVTDEGLKIQLSLNVNNYTRLVFFSVPLKYISIYKKHIFPIVQSYNFVPITVDEIIQSNDNLLATISSFIDKSSIVVIDISTDTTRHELGMILNNKKSNQNIIVINGEKNDNNIQFNLNSISNLTIPENLIDDLDDFISNFDDCFSKFAGKIQEQINSEAKRLFGKGEYAAAVISSVTLFEDILRNTFNAHFGNSRYITSLSKLFNLAIEKGLIMSNQAGELKEWILLRNKFVHSTDRNIKKPLAQRIITSIEDAILFIEKRKSELISKPLES